MRVVGFEREVFVFEVEDVPDRGIELHNRQLARCTRELFAGLVEVIQVEMRVAECVDEFSRLQSADLRHHQGQQGVRSDVERNPEKQVRAALIELAGQLSLGYVKLEERMAGHQCHLVEIGHVPRRDEQATRVGIAFDLVDDLGDLIDVAAIRGRPGAPLITVHRTELSIFIGALIGACVGFLWYNAYPAQVFMGDTGSLTLGGIIAALAIIVRKEWLIPIFCGVFLVEVLSVTIQVTYFRYTKKKYGEGRRVFLMSPLHHHYQKLGYHESKIVTRFWIVTILCVAFAIATLKIR